MTRAGGKVYVKISSINLAQCTQKTECLQADKQWNKISFHHMSLVPLHYRKRGRDSSHTQVPLKEEEGTSKNNQGDK